MKKGQSISTNTIIYITIAVIILAVVLVVINSRIKGVNKDFEERADEYREKCAVSGSGRTCESVSSCENVGGINLGAEWADCGATKPICCQY